MQPLDPETGRLALASMLRERSPLGALKILYSRIGRFFQIPMPAFHPFVVGGPNQIAKCWSLNGTRLNGAMQTLSPICCDMASWSPTAKNMIIIAS